MCNNYCGNYCVNVSVVLAFQCSQLSTIVLLKCMLYTDVSRWKFHFLVSGEYFVNIIRICL